ncbi:EamA family transporter [Luteimonas saliphila]|uniref:EamA family transporter n=1 Tax=Luteimonas saliphila TaxID=2804919 RepID=UPI00192DFE8F|nr:EamA family transporter [Luteimonas saliphila]
MTVLLTVYGQFAIKWQILASPPMPTDPHGRFVYVAQLFLSPLVISALVAAVLASVSWMVALTRLPLSHAYPMTAFTFVAVVLGSHTFFAEPVTTPKLVGLAFIVTGIIVGSQG